MAKAEESLANSLHIDFTINGTKLLKSKIIGVSK